MHFRPDRLTSVRKSLGLNKAQAARCLNMSAMGYGRYERGEREPSFQIVSFIAQAFGTTSDFLYGLSDNPTMNTITISVDDNPELFELVTALKNNQELAARMLAYLKRIDDA